MEANMKGFKRVWLLLLTMVLANFAVAGIIVDTVAERVNLFWTVSPKLKYFSLEYFGPLAK